RFGLANWRERELVPVPVDLNRRAWGGFPFEQERRHRIREPLLNNALQRASAVGGIEPLVRQRDLGGIADFNGKPRLPHLGLATPQLDTDDLRQFRFAERVEQDRLVDAVEELR